MLRTSIDAATLDPAGVVGAYKNLAHVERDFRSIKADDLDLRPIYHRLEDRVRAHVLLVMLAAYLTWHLRRTLAPLTFTDPQPPTRHDPVAPATRSAAATTKVSHRADENGTPIRSFQAPLHHLGILPQRHPLRHRRTPHPHPRRTHRDPAPSLRTALHPHPPHPHVDRTPTTKNDETPAQPRNDHTPAAVTSD